MNTKENKKDEKRIFFVTEKDLQQEALKRIGRKLTDREICSASKGIEVGLLFDIDTVFRTAIEEAVE